MIRRPVPQSSHGMSYFVGRSDHAHPDEPIEFWYEIFCDGACHRQVEVFTDGRKIRDALINYPDGLTDFGIGSLHGASFWESEWDDERDPESDENLWMESASAEEFEQQWLKAG